MILLLLLIRAGHEGFEPTNAGVRVQCLTAWRVPNMTSLKENNSYYSKFAIKSQDFFSLSTNP